MDSTRIKQLAGMKLNEADKNLAYLQEVVQLSDDMSDEDLSERLAACSRALKLVNKEPNPALRKRWRSAVFVNLNKIRGALQRRIAAEEGGQGGQQKATPPVRQTAPQGQPGGMGQQDAQSIH